MLERGGRARLREKAALGVSVSAQCGRQEFECHEPLEAEVTSAIDDPHSAGAELLLDLVPLRDDGSRREECVARGRQPTPVAGGPIQQSCPVVRREQRAQHRAQRCVIAAGASDELVPRVGR